MQDLEFVCLANSKREGGRCIAGIMTASGQWVRPVSKDGGGTLFPSDYRLADGSEPRILDIVKLRAVAHPEPHQPENWVIGGGQWKRIGRMPAWQAKIFLRRRTIPGPDLFGDERDRIAYQELARHPAKSSLCVVEPVNLKWQIRSNIRGNKQARARFTLAGAEYDLSVTDPVWEPRLYGLNYGFHAKTAIGIGEVQEVFLTVSLGGVFQGDCYKLVAAVIVL